MSEENQITSRGINKSNLKVFKDIICNESDNEIKHLTLISLNCRSVMNKTLSICDLIT